MEGLRGREGLREREGSGRVSMTGNVPDGRGARDAPPRPFRSPRCRQSDRRASVGGTRAALAAGTQQATRATAANSAGVVRKVSGSWGATP